MIDIKVSKETLLRIENDFKDYITQRNIGYIIFVAKTNENIITAYNNKKGINFKVTFQGKDYMDLAKKYCEDPSLIHKKKKEDKESLYFIDINNQIGSDEVGTGDFLGPIVVCATYVDINAMKIINEYHIQDSKKMTDKKILELIPQIKNRIHYECKLLPNYKYNNAIKKPTFNINKIKCIMHNYVLFNLKQKCPSIQNIYMDQFLDKEKYYSYLKNVNNVVKDITFKEKGETYFPSVALASCFARYFFLEYMKELEVKYQTTIPLGASKDVDEFSINFVKKYGINELENICKANFKNLSGIKKEISF
ncbi:MAG: ribonuclease HIII [Firmicutes bacterium]|uniref:Ribonuclease n=1 Tax=Candidatus Onthovivens merdipullorum TaxID=2840889 RepID=A0A9D9DIG3_9BACL|nr:ribonuclease HIII [Candidatus Onthovivens merdipullorum]